MKKIFIPLLLASLLGGCLSRQPRSEDNDSAPPPKQTKLDKEREKYKTNDPRECAQNFTFDGSFLRGRTYKTNAFVKGVSLKQAVTRAAKYLTTDGWQINSADGKMGIVSASQGVSYGNGKTVPLNVSVDQGKGGVRVDITYTTSGGVSSPVDAVRDTFCAIVTSVGGK